MNRSPRTEMAGFRFVRDSGGEFVSLPARGRGERCLLAADTNGWGLVRLHLFEGAAKNDETREDFERELGRIAEIGSEVLSRLVSWGREGKDLYYADALPDGEPLPDYLERTGGVPAPVAAEWVAGHLDFLEGAGEGVPSLERFPPSRFQVVLDRRGRVRLLLSEFLGWNEAREAREAKEEPGGSAREEEADRLFRGLLGGSSENPPELPELRRLAESADDHRREVALPSMPVREWLRAELAKSYPGTPDYDLPAAPEPGDELYGVAATVRGSGSTIQVLPGPECLPRDEWFPQHHEVTRRPGRPMAYQLHVNYIEDRGAITLVGEERVEGSDLASIVLEAGPREPGEVARIAGCIRAALDALEKRPGACAVWWLPPENVHLLTGTRSPVESLERVSDRGGSAWEEFPWKLRLHQTTTTLREGTALPPLLRELSRLPGRKYDAARRGGVGLPLVFFLLSGTALDWARPVGEQADLPDPVREFLEDWRLRLVGSPESLEGSFFDSATSILAEAASVPREGDRGGTETESGPVREREEDEERESPAPDESAPGVAENPVGRGPESGIDAETEPEPEPGVAEASLIVDAVGPSPGIAEAVPLERSDEASEGRASEPSRKPRRTILSAGHFWVALWALVLALVAGYLLHGWSVRQGRYIVDEEPRLPVTDYRAPGEPGAGEIRVELESFLIGRVRPDLLGSVRGLSRPEHRDRIERALEAMAGKGDAEAARYRALLALAGPASESERTELLAEAARLGDAPAQFLLARRSLLGRGGGVSDEEAEELLRRSASLGNVDAQEWLASREAERGEADEARRWIEAATRKGDVSARYQLGLFHANGLGGPVDWGEAVSCFRRAAEQGDARAMYAYARCLESGRGIAVSSTEARLWMKKAAALGHVPAIRWCEARSIERPAMAER